jgi:hypothetical protein
MMSNHTEKLLFEIAALCIGLALCIVSAAVLSSL